MIYVTLWDGDDSIHQYSEKVDQLTIRSIMELPDYDGQNTIKGRFDWALIRDNKAWVDYVCIDKEGEWDSDEELKARQQISPSQILDD